MHQKRQFPCKLIWWHAKQNSFHRTRGNKCSVMLCILEFRPENLPRLFDLVKIKEQKFATAFYYSLRDTAVAKDLNQATRVGLQVLLLADCIPQYNSMACPTLPLHHVTVLLRVKHVIVWSHWMER